MDMGKTVMSKTQATVTVTVKKRQRLQKADSEGHYASFRMGL
jgi:hypothetical protein